MIFNAIDDSSAINYAKTKEHENSDIPFINRVSIFCLDENRVVGLL